MGKESAMGEDEKAAAGYAHLRGELEGRGEAVRPRPEPKRGAGKAKAPKGRVPR